VASALDVMKITGMLHAAGNAKTIQLMVWMDTIQENTFSVK
jgi:hypothetical protein